ncbi:hypothetical protein P885DRAFT_45445 [Corynascus similis CBS 632.67]
MAYTDHDRTILGSLTTVFTPPAPCTYAVGLCSACDVAWWGQTCAPTSVQDDTACWPPTTDGAPEPTEAALLGRGFYSPGLKCPAGYTTACTAVAGGKSQWKVQFQMEAEETFAGCCPTGFHCDNLRGQTCRMVATSTLLPTVSCQSGSSNNFGFTTLPNAEVEALNLYAPMIQIAWKSSDRPETSTTSRSRTISSPTTSVLNPTPTGDEPYGSATTSDDFTLSTGAIAGIAVGAAVVFLLIFATAFFIFRRRRRYMNQIAGGSSTSGDDNDHSYHPPSNTIAAESKHGHDRAEMFVENWRTPSESPWQQQQQGYGPLRGGVPPPPGYFSAAVAGVGTNPVEMPAQRYT